MLQQTSSTRQIALPLALSVGLGLIAVLLGLAGALAGWDGQLLIFSIAVPVTLLLFDYRIGLILAILLLPYTNSRLVPGSGMLTLTNVLLLGVFVSFLLRWIRMHMVGRGPALPVGKELVWWYLVPLTAAIGIGSLHLGEISHHYLVLNKLHSYGLKEYWVSLYVKQILLVAIACVIGAAVAEQGKGLRFVVATIVSGVLFVAAIVAVVVSTGATLLQLQNVRDLLIIIGRHNNDAGFLLMCVIATTLFMREYVQHGFTRLVLLIIVFVLMAGLLLTMSRGAFLGVVVVLLYYVWRFRRPGLIVAALAISVAGFAVAPAAIKDRLLLGLQGGTSVQAQVGGSTAGGDQLTQGRVWIWRQVAPEIINSPLIGRGVMSTQWSSAAKAGVYYGNHPHSLYLEVLMDLGIVGAIFMVLFFRFLWRLFRRLSEDERLAPAMRGYFLGSAASLLAVLAYGISNGHWFPSVEQAFVWVSIGLALGYQRWLAMQPQAQVSEAVKGSRPRSFRVPDRSILKPRLRR
jgi:O-antigen ligase